MPDREPCGKYPPPIVKNPDEISPAEKRVLRLLSDGLSNSDISLKLHITQRTVETHVHHMLQKCNLKNRLQLVNKFRPQELDKATISVDRLQSENDRLTIECQRLAIENQKLRSAISKATALLSID
jgi:DNA-binding CsgD family transcriptional regulator